MNSFCVRHKEYKDSLGVVVNLYDVQKPNPKNPGQVDFSTALTICHVVWYKETADGLQPDREAHAPSRESADQLEFIGMPNEIFGDDDDDDKDDEIIRLESRVAELELMLEDSDKSETPNESA